MIDSGCSRHMTGDRRWFSSLTPVMSKEYITFGDNGKGRVLSEGAIKVSDNFALKRVALVKSLGFNLLSVSQLLDEGFEVRFKRGASRVLDSRGDLVCMIIPKGQIFRADFTQSFGPARVEFARRSPPRVQYEDMRNGHSFESQRNYGPRLTPRGARTPLVRRERIPAVRCERILVVKHERIPE